MTGLSSASLAAKLGIEESQLTEVVNLNFSRGLVRHPGLK